MRACSNKVFDCLEDGAKTPKQLAEETGASARALRILMNALVGLGFIKKDRQGRYSLTPESAAFLISKKPGTQCGVFWNHCAADNLTMAAISRYRSRRSSGRSREPGNRRHGIFQSTGGKHHPHELPACAKARRSFKVSESKERNSRARSGAGSGIWGIALSQKSPRVRVTAVDWAGMIPTTKRITQKFGVGDRFNYVEGDMLEANFGSGYDIATLGHILHSEGEDRSRRVAQERLSAR